MEYNYAGRGLKQKVYNYCTKLVALLLIELSSEYSDGGIKS